MTKAEIAIMCLQSMTRNDDVLLFHSPSYIYSVVHLIVQLINQINKFVPDEKTKQIRLFLLHSHLYQPNFAPQIMFLFL